MSGHSLRLALETRSVSEGYESVGLSELRPSLTLRVTKFLLGVVLPSLFVFASNAIADEPFRPEPGKFPTLDKAHSYRGELVFVDHANRRGSVRIQTEGKFRFISPSPFAMLPYPYLFRHSWKTTL